jgi:hypothetical protein
MSCDSASLLVMRLLLNFQEAVEVPKERLENEE